VGKRPKAPKKPKKEKVGKGALVAAVIVDEPGSGAVTPSVFPEDVEMVSASSWMNQSLALRNGTAVFCPPVSCTVPVTIYATEGYIHNFTLGQSIVFHVSLRNDDSFSFHPDKPYTTS